MSYEEEDACVSHMRRRCMCHMRRRMHVSYEEEDGNMKGVANVLLMCC